MPVQGVHMLLADAGAEYAQLLGGSAYIEDYINTEAALCDFVQAKMRSPRKLMLSFDEYGTMMRPLEGIRHPGWGPYNLYHTHYAFRPDRSYVRHDPDNMEQREFPTGDMADALGSASVLFPYFREATRLGLASANISPDRLFAHLRSLGMEAEDSMFAETHGVNTHKGAIFLFGILCAATGRVHALGLAKVPENICQTVALMTKTLAGECREIAQRAHPSTNGEALIQKNNILGVRGEVMAGLPSVRTYSLPLLETLLARNCSPDRAGAAALLNLVANVTDTNVIHRSSLARAGTIRKMVQDMLDREYIPDEEALLDLDDMFIRENISPGGCADLLGVTFFLHFLGESPG